MSYLKNYLSKIVLRGNEKLAESIYKTSEDIGKNYISTFSFISHEIGLLFGNVQSGKTGQIFGVICKAADLGFPVFLMLTTDNVVLQTQTLERVKSDLEGFCICGEDDSEIFIENSLVQPVIVVLKKNSRVLRKWANIFNTTGCMKGNPLFIIDDEADAASLNTFINRKGSQKSSINKYLDSIKSRSSSSLYLQVTGTPQALLLQTIASGWHPYFTYYFQPGSTYLGGDFFFPTSKTPSCITFLETVKEAERETVIHHITVSAQILAAGGKVCNCLIHPSVRQAAHRKFAKEVEEVLSWCKTNSDEFKKKVAECWADISPQKTKKLPVEIVIEKAESLVLNDEVNVCIMNGSNVVDISAYTKGSNIIIGGNTLGRGVTFPGLQTIYYTRSSKKPQADTMWQHSRMFGYDRDSGMMMVYIDERLYKLFSDINATNNSIIAQIERGIDNVKIFYPEGLNPTRKNVLDKKHVEIISGGTNYYPFYPDNDNIEKISELLMPFDSAVSHYQVSLRLIKKILNHIIPSADFKLSAFICIIDTILSKNPTGQGILIVRRERDVAQGTGALLSPNDWKVGAQFTDKPVLTMYQVTGNKGWKGKKLWIPNIKLPHEIMYYDVLEDDSQGE